MFLEREGRRLVTSTQTGMRQRTVTLKDVAQAAGVSIATASKALNGKSNVRAETRQRVQEAAATLAFTPNSLAQAMLAGQSGTVGLLTNDLEGRFSIPILMGAEDAFGAGHMSVFLCDAREDAIRERYHLRALLGRRVDGLIVVGSRTDPRASLGRDLPVPVIYAYAPSLDPADCSLVPDNINAGVMAIQHVLAVGRRRIAHISGDVSYAAATDRARGVTRALAEAGLPLIGDQVRYGSWTEGWGRAATTALMQQNNEVDAIVCGSDQIARGALDALRDQGVSVPDDVAVIGFDNWEPFVTGARPRLTSIDMNFETLGRTAAQRLVEAINGDQHAGVEAMPCGLVVRESTAGS